VLFGLQTRARSDLRDRIAPFISRVVINGLNAENGGGEVLIGECFLIAGVISWSSRAAKCLTLLHCFTGAIGRACLGRDSLTALPGCFE
jgi:hypothetical protein